MTSPQSANYTKGLSLKPDIKRHSMVFDKLEIYLGTLTIYKSYESLRFKLFDSLHNYNILLLPFDKSLIEQIFMYGLINYTLTVNKIIIDIRPKARKYLT